MGGAARTWACLEPSGSIWGRRARARAFRSLPRARALGRAVRASRSVARLPDSSGSFSEVLGPSGRWADTGARAGAARACRGRGLRARGVMRAMPGRAWAADWGSRVLRAQFLVLPPCHAHVPVRMGPMVGAGAGRLWPC